MKKSLLLLALGSIAMNVGAQERVQSPVKTDRSSQEQTIGQAARIELNKHAAQNGARKTTAGGTRWYNYAQAMDTSMNYHHCTLLGEGDAAYYAYTGLSTTTI